MTNDPTNSNVPEHPHTRAGRRLAQTDAMLYRALSGEVENAGADYVAMALERARATTDLLSEAIQHGELALEADSARVSASVALDLVSNELARASVVQRITCGDDTE